MEDSGPGIPVEKRKLLFQKYQTALAVISQENVSFDGSIFVKESFRCVCLTRFGTGHWSGTLSKSGRAAWRRFFSRQVLP